MIDLDHAATTRLLPEALEAMLPYFTEYYANPSSVTSAAAEPKRAIAEARKKIAAMLGAQSSEIFFTSGGTEADNWVLWGAASSANLHLPAGSGFGGHVVTSAIEHHAVLNTCAALERLGVEVTCVLPDRTGRIRPEDVETAIRPDTFLVSVMAANNEVGTIEPVAEIAEAAHRHGILFHTDAVQAFGHIPIAVRSGASGNMAAALEPGSLSDSGIAADIDLLSASAHKFGGPRGAGFLYVRKGVRIPAFLRGGAQERGRRAGTENTPAIVGMAEAAFLAAERMEERAIAERTFRDYLAERLLHEIPGSRVNGPPAGNRRLNNNLNMTFTGVRAETLLVLLDMEGIAASAGAACASGAAEPSHVLRAMGISPEDARGSIRFTVGSDNTMEEMQEAAAKIVSAVRRLRKT